MKMERLEKDSPEWVAETERWVELLRKSLSDPANTENRNAVIGSMEKLGFILSASTDTQ
jgi:hypothetical protein